MSKRDTKHGRTGMVKDLVARRDGTIKGGTVSSVLKLQHDTTRAIANNVRG